MQKIIDDARPGLSTAAAAAAPTAAPIMRSAPRRDVERASWRDRSSKRSATASSLVCADGLAPSQVQFKRFSGGPKDTLGHLMRFGVDCSQHQQTWSELLDRV